MNGKVWVKAVQRFAIHIQIFWECSFEYKTMPCSLKFQLLCGMIKKNRTLDCIVGMCSGDHLYLLSCNNLLTFFQNLIKMS